MKYLWNVALSESLLQALSALEVGVRSSVHNPFTDHVGSEYWFQAVLQPEEMEIVSDVWNTLSKCHKQPPSPGKVIAELTFGFWPLLFNDRYHHLWWNNKTAQFRATCPNIPTGLPPHQAITRKTVHERIALCQKLRNRAMHHGNLSRPVDCVSRCLSLAS